MEKQVNFNSGSLSLEGYFSRAEGKSGVVITHPHPLYGGDMNNGVVTVIQKAYEDKGVSALRFNFRGAGRSEGAYDDGVGEQGDVIAALEFLKSEGIETFELAGYSFGAWVNAGIDISGVGVTRMIMVSPPIGFIEFNGIDSLPHLDLVITGSADDIAPADQIRRAIPTWNPEARLEIIEGADHFYSGRIRALSEVLGEYI